MRFFILLLFAEIFLPKLSNAQSSLFNTFRSGSYTLFSDKTHRVITQLKLKSNTVLLTKDNSGKIHKLTPNDVQSFRIEKANYVVAYDFEVRQGLADVLIEQAFVEQLDSGRVVLMRYTYNIGAPAAMGASGMMTGGQSENEVYLLRWGRGTSVSAIQASWLTGGGGRFREALLPYIGQRPDLIQLIENRSITVRDLPALVKALNTEQAYGQSSSASTNN